MAAGPTGAIGYVEYAYAKQNKMNYTQLHEQGRRDDRSPDSKAFQAAAANADWAKRRFLSAS